MISFRFGWALSSAVASLKALSFRSSHGRSATIFIFGYFSALSAAMCFCHSFMFAAVSEAVMIANSPLPPMSFGGFIHQRLADAFRRRLVARKNRAPRAARRRHR